MNVLAMYVMSNIPQICASVQFPSSTSVNGIVVLDVILSLDLTRLIPTRPLNTNRGRCDAKLCAVHPSAYRENLWGIYISPGRDIGKRVKTIDYLPTPRHSTSIFRDKSPELHCTFADYVRFSRDHYPFHRIKYRRDHSRHRDYVI